jgi:hypothetical protein
MDLLIEKQNDIIKNNNSAQDVLKALLHNISAESDEIMITQELHGNLDFSVLKTNGFKRVKAIRLSPGEITNISNLPEGLEVFVCKKNMLFRLENIPSSIVELDLELNYLLDIDLSKLHKLKKLHLGDNRLKQIEDIPSGLEELFLQNNEIVHLNLKEANKLRVLNIENNRAIIIENIPASIVDLRTGNNPYIELNYINSKNNIKNKHTGEARAEKISDFKVALNKYFDMKTRYEEINHKEKVKLKRKYPTQKKKRIYIPKCIHCKRVGGTIFEKRNTTYIALCGITSDPCKLKIEIDAGVNYNVDQFVNIEQAEINKNKTAILKEKMNSIYGYSSKEEIAKNFKRAISEYQFDSEEYVGLVEKHNQLYYDKSREDQIVRKQKQILDLKQAIKTLMSEYAKTHNPDLLSNAVNIQMKELDPEVHNLRLLKYEIMEMRGITQTVGEAPREVSHEVETESESSSKKEKASIKQNLNTLFQRYSGLHKMEHLVGQEPFVKTFDK